MPEDKVLFYEGAHYMYSNFSAFAFWWKGILWPTSEHAYQAEKFSDPLVREMIRLALSPYDAKRMSRMHSEFVRIDWHDVKLAVMEEIIRAKLAQHPYILKKLLATGDREIVEDSPHDGFWGRGREHAGKNHMGRIWMKLRSEASEVRP
ncbi:MAG: hypothetical protein JWN50_750 [Parcubacteria group bacterium]|nr:hypothetical protein [Parcubacteria group bacterium]